MNKQSLVYWNLWQFMVCIVIKKKLVKAIETVKLPLGDEPILETASEAPLKSFI